MEATSASVEGSNGNIISTGEGSQGTKTEFTVESYYNQSRFRSKIERVRKLMEEEGREPTVEEVLELSFFSLTKGPELEHWIKEKLPIKPKKIIDVGSGLGGPARFVAKKTQAEVTALEFLPELHGDAQDMHELCKNDLDVSGGSVKYLNGDFMNPPEGLTDFDVLYSQGTFLYFKDKDALAKRIRASLKPGGYFFIDDFIAVGSRNEFARNWLHEQYSTPDGHLPFKWEYIRALEENGLQVLEAVDGSEIYSKLVWDRFEDYLHGGSYFNTAYTDIENALELFRTQIRTYNHVNFEDYPLAYKEYCHNGEEKQSGRATGLLLYGRRLPEHLEL